MPVLAFLLSVNYVFLLFCL